MSFNPYHQSSSNGTAPYQSNVAQKYMRDRLESMSPIQLLVTIYDIAIESCNRRDRQRASKAIVELISALNFEYKEIADRFYGIYEFCMGQIKSGNFDQAKELLQDLRDAWVESSKQNPTEIVQSTPASMPSIQA